MWSTVPSFILSSIRQMQRCLWKATEIQSQQHMYEEGPRSEFAQL